MLVLRKILWIWGITLLWKVEGQGDDNWWNWNILGYPIYTMCILYIKRR